MNIGKKIVKTSQTKKGKTVWLIYLEYIIQSSRCKIIIPNGFSKNNAFLLRVSNSFIHVINCKIWQRTNRQETDIESALLKIGFRCKTLKQGFGLRLIKRLASSWTGKRTAHLSKVSPKSNFFINVKGFKNGESQISDF